MTWTDGRAFLVDRAGGVIIILLVAAIAIPLSARLIDDIVRRRVVVRSIGKEARLDEQRNETISRVLRTTAKVVILALATIMVLGEFGIDTAALIASAGIVGIAVGFGAQYLVRDYTTGVLIVLEDQFRVGDVVTINDVSGAVEDINLRMTILRDLDGVVHQIPNGEIRIASNQSKEFARVNLDIGIAYESDLAKVIDVIDVTGRELAEDPDWVDKIRTPPTFLRVNAFADSAIVVKIVGDTEPLQQWAVAGELRKRLKIAFDREGIEIPFPQRVVRYTGGETVSNSMERSLDVT
jgi:moderate conductance mechanosensitive channel